MEALLNTRMEVSFVGSGVLNCSQVPNISLCRYCVSLILPA